MMQTAYPAQEYRTQEVFGASPVRLVIMTYDIALQACEQKDLARAARAVAALRDALNLDCGEVSVGLFALYQWCLDCIRGGNYAEAGKTLRGLREAWAAVEQRLSPGAAAAGELPQPVRQMAQWTA